ncbi:MAG: MGMT family protein [Methanosarcinales archaeon]|nr:MGMT family protein [Methanosarcinales archaeon]
MNTDTICEYTLQYLNNWFNDNKINFNAYGGEIDLSEYLHDLQEYLSGEIIDFNKYETDLSSLPEFTQTVLFETLKIHYGKTITYGELADCIGKSNAARAVGQALSKNPYPIIIPCHRIVGKNKIGGWFNTRTELKKKLLMLEARNSMIY